MKTKLLLFVSIVILAAALNIPLFERFTMTNEKTGDIVFQDKVEKYKEFYVSFTHSVNRTPVNEYYRIAGDKLILEKATFYSYGAGMPEYGEYGSDAPIVVDDIVLMDNIDKEFKRFTYFAGTYANHSLNGVDTKIYFSEVVKPQTPVTFEVKALSAIALLKSYWFGYKA